NCIPFTCRGVTRYQQIYDAAGFGGASGVVGSIAFPRDAAYHFVDELFGTTTDNGSFSLHLDLLVTLAHTSERQRLFSRNSSPEPIPRPSLTDSSTGPPSSSQAAG